MIFFSKCSVSLMGDMVHIWNCNAHFLNINDRSVHIQFSISCAQHADVLVLLIIIIYQKKVPIDHYSVIIHFQKLLTIPLYIVKNKYCTLRSTFICDKFNQLKHGLSRQNRKKNHYYYHSNIFIIKLWFL